MGRHRPSIPSLVLLLLLGPLLFVNMVNGRSNNCPTKKFSDDFSGCKDCKLCLKNSSFTRDSAVIQPECKENNLKPEFTLKGVELYTWCDHQSRKVTDLLSTTTTPGIPSTVPLSEKPTGISSTRLLSEGPTVIPLSTKQPGQSREVVPNDSTSNSALGHAAIASVVILGVLAFGILFYLCKKKRAGSSTSSTPQSGSNSSLGKPVTIELPPESIPTENDSQSTPLLPDVCIKADPGTDVNENSSLKLYLVKSRCEQSAYKPSNQHLTWEHLNTGLKYFGWEVIFEKVKTWHGGEYEVYVNSKKVSINITVYNSRPGVESDTPSANTETGSSEAVESYMRPTPIELTDEDRHQLAVCANPINQPTEIWITQPESDDRERTYPILPSAQSQNQPNLLGQAIATLMVPSGTEYIRRYGNGVQHKCILSLRNLVNDEDTMQHLAILMDTTAMLRMFMAIKGKLATREIDFIYYCTRGKGNTVKGFISYILGNTNQQNLTAADFSSFLIDRGWSGADKVIHLLFLAHPTCVICKQFQERYGYTDPEGAGVQSRLPGYEYHFTNRVCHCSQTLNDLARGTPGVSEQFRQESSIDFYTRHNPIWRHLGNELGQMPTHVLDHIEFHAGSSTHDNSYLAMLDRLVALYPDLKVGTMIQWLLDHSYRDAANKVLEYHMMCIDCDFCRGFSEKPVQ